MVGHNARLLELAGVQSEQVQGKDPKWRAQPMNRYVSQRILESLFHLLSSSKTEFSLVARSVTICADWYVVRFWRWLFTGALQKETKKTVKSRLWSDTGEWLYLRVEIKVYRGIILTVCVARLGGRADWKIRWICCFCLTLTHSTRSDLPHNTLLLTT